MDWSPVKQLLAAVIEPGLYGALRAGDDDKVERICAKIMQSPTNSAWWPALEYALMALPTKLDEALQETVAEAIEFHILLADKPADFDITARVEEIRRPAAQTARDRLRLLRTRAPGRPPVPDLRDRVMWALYDSESQSRVAKTLGVSVSKLSKWAAASEFGDWRGVVEYHRRLRALDFSGLPSQQEVGNEDEEQG